MSARLCRYCTVILTLVCATAVLVGQSKTLDHMYTASKGEIPVLTGSHHLIFQGERDITGYNNHPYLIYHSNRFYAIWSSGFNGGSHTGQRILFATSTDGKSWTPSRTLVSPSEDSYYIARGLWIRGGHLIALGTRCTGENRETNVEALEAYEWDQENEDWKLKAIIGQHITTNFPPTLLPTGEWLLTYRYKKKNRVDGVIIGGNQALDSWHKIPFQGSRQNQFTEANAILRSDGKIAVHLRLNNRASGSGFLYRSLSEDGGRSFTEPVRTDFPDCKSKHFCLKLSNDIYILISNPYTRKTLQVAGSQDGIVFSRESILRYKPIAVRNPGHDKRSSPYTYPHAIERDGYVYIAYSVNRDDIWLTRVSIGEIEQKLGKRNLP
ncbi:hypothetical protein BVY01_01775 [bacterium I07]|nr:hypothetical protein BVY01_01775 [bacterium I07]